MFDRSNLFISRDPRLVYYLLGFNLGAGAGRTHLWQHEVLGAESG